jgi:lipopolysaccharide export LptBFGC system permease protein LptF
VILPGRRLHALAARICSTQTMERFIDPTIADLQAEYASALRSGNVWRSRTALLGGYVAFAKVALWCAIAGVTGMRRNWNREDHSGLVRVLWRSAAAILGVTLLIWLPELSRTREMLEDLGSEASLFRLMTYLLPMTLPLSLPIGLAFGAALGAHGRRPSRRLMCAIMLVALATAAGSLATMAWVIPASNQSYRVAMMGQPLLKGDREMSFAELRRALATADVDRSRRLLFEFHKRLGIAGAPVTFAAFALVVVMRHRLRRTVSIAAIVVVSFGYYVALWLGDGFNRDGTLSPQFSAWMPQIALVLTTVLAALPVRRPSSASLGPGKAGPTSSA